MKACMFCKFYLKGIRESGRCSKLDLVKTKYDICGSYEPRNLAAQSPERIVRRVPSIDPRKNKTKVYLR